MSRLEQLSISTQESLSASLLVHTPRLTTLKVSTDEELSPQFLISTPLLESLRLDAQAWESIPFALLHEAPHLTYLKLLFPPIGLPFRLISRNGFQPSKPSTCHRD